VMAWSEEDGNDGERARVLGEGVVAAPDVDGGSSARSIYPWKSGLEA
jgi:hypothetical protein